jgi:hypothetical protein
VGAKNKSKVRRDEEEGGRGGENLYRERNEKLRERK